MTMGVALLTSSLLLLIMKKLEQIKMEFISSCFDLRNILLNQ